MWQDVSSVLVESQSIPLSLTHLSGWMSLLISSFKSISVFFYAGGSCQSVRSCQILKCPRWLLFHGTSPESAKSILSGSAMAWFNCITAQRLRRRPTVHKYAVMICDIMWHSPSVPHIGKLRKLPLNDAAKIVSLSDHHLSHCSWRFRHQPGWLSLIPNRGSGERGPCFFTKTWKMLSNIYVKLIKGFIIWTLSIFGLFKKAGLSKTVTATPVPPRPQAHSMARSREQRWTENC